MFALILALASADYIDITEGNSYPFADVPAMENVDFEETNHYAYIDFEVDEGVDLEDNSYPFADVPAQEEGFVEAPSASNCKGKYCKKSKPNYYEDNSDEENSYPFADVPAQEREMNHDNMPGTQYVKPQYKHKHFHVEENSYPFADVPAQEREMNHGDLPQTGTTKQEKQQENAFWCGNVPCHWLSQLKDGR